MPTPRRSRSFGHSAAHQRLMMANLAASLFAAEGITTTEAKAKALRPIAEKLITKAKKAQDGPMRVHRIRQIQGYLGDREMTQDQTAIAGKPGGLVGDMIVAAALAVDGQQRQGVFGRRPKLPAVLAKGLFQGRDIEATQDIAQRGRHPAPAQLVQLAELPAMNLNP